ncbi:MAG: hypothetical protein HY819_06655 [Acidobacteria bacterium]|nr:hypothetical protein [Acidobacteriota bacterium]
MIFSFNFKSFFNHKLSKLVLLLISIGFLAISFVFAQKNKSIDARIVYEKPQNERVLIGDRLKLVITVLHNVGQKYDLKLDKEGIKFFEISGNPIIETSQDGIVGRTQIEVKLTPFKTGKLPIPPLLVVNNFNEELQTPALEVEVESLVESPDAQIKDIKLIPLGVNNGWLEPVVLSLLLTSIGFYLTLRLLNPPITRFLLAYWGKFFLKRQSDKPIILIEQISLEDKTIAELKELLNSDLVYKDLKEFHVKLSEIMVNYAIVRYGVEQQEYTTSELLALFREKAVPLLVISTFEQVLGVCDMVKFAKFHLDIESARLSVKQAIDLFKSLNYRASLKTDTKQ